MVVFFDNAPDEFFREGIFPFKLCEICNWRRGENAAKVEDYPFNSLHG